MDQKKPVARFALFLFLTFLHVWNKPSKSPFRSKQQSAGCEKNYFLSKQLLNTSGLIKNGQRFCFFQDETLHVWVWCRLQFVGCRQSQKDDAKKDGLRDLTQLPHHQILLICQKQ